MPLTDVQANARYWLCWNALEVLYSDLSMAAVPRTRKELFTTFEPDAGEPTAPYDKEAAAVKWQQKMLEVFVEKNLAILSPSDHEALYLCGDGEKVKAYLDDWNDGQILIPSLFDFNTAIYKSNKKNTEELQSESQPESQPETADAPQPKIKSVAPCRIEVIPTEANDPRLVTELANSICALAKHLQGFEENLSAHFGELEKKIGGMNKRLDTNDSRFVEINQKLDSALNKLKDTAELSTQIKDNSDKLSSINSSIEALSVRSALNNLAVQLSAYVKQTSIQTDEAKALLQVTLDKLTEV